MKNQTIQINPNIDELFDCESMYAIVNLGFNYKDSYMEYRLLRDHVKEDIRPAILGTDDKQTNCYLIPLNNPDDIYNLTRIHKSFHKEWIYIISFKKPDYYIYTLVNFHFPTEQEIIVGKLNPKVYTQSPKSSMWIKGKDNLNYYNIQLMG